MDRRRTQISRKPQGHLENRGMGKVGDKDRRKGNRLETNCHSRWRPLYTESPKPTGQPGAGACLPSSLPFPTLLCMGCRGLIPKGHIPHTLGPPSSWLDVALVEGGVQKKEARVCLPICSSGGISDGSRVFSITLVPVPLTCHGP